MCPRRWITEATGNVISTDQLKKYNAARKLKKAGQKLMAINRVKAAAGGLAAAAKAAQAAQ